MIPNTRLDAKQANHGRRAAIRRRARTTGSALMAILVVGLTLADDQPDPDQAFRDHARQQAATYEIHLADGETETAATPLDQALLSWTNPVDGFRTYGEVFLWTAKGRPAAVLSLYRYNGLDGVEHEHHEFSSLAEVGRNAVHPSGKTWAPDAGGVQLQVVPDSDPPADSPRLRLRQMKVLAQRFTAGKTERDGTQRGLRLMPQPVYRYEGDADDVLDGTLFAFVEVTDPEAFLLIEARTGANGPEWHYALARMTSVGLHASDREEQVWEVPVLPGRDVYNRADKTYTALTFKLSADQ